MKLLDFVDLHCDTITVCMEKDRELAHNDLHISLEKLQKGSKWCQAFAIFLPDAYRGEAAVDYYRRALCTFHREMEKNSDRIRQVQTVPEVEHCFEDGLFAALLTVEGGSALAGELSRVETLRRDGVRILTLTWNGPNELGSGNVTQNGLTHFGVQAVREMEELGIVVDVSHLNDRGFWDLCRVAKKPFVATHSNSRAICGHSRNLTDEQFIEIRNRGGLVGMNYYRNFIVDGGKTQDIGDLVAHIQHFLELGGEDVLALGSDFDGADVPDYLNSLEKVDNLRQALIASGISEQITQKILVENAMSFARRNF